MEQVVRHCCFVCNYRDWEDIRQIVLLKIIKAAEHHNPKIGVFSHYANRIARLESYQTINNIMGKWMVSLENSDNEMFNEDEIAFIDHSLTEADKKELAEKILKEAKLTEREEKAFRAFAEGYKYKEIATNMGWSEKQVSSAMYKATRKLKIVANKIEEAESNREKT